MSRAAARAHAWDALAEEASLVLRAEELVDRALRAGADAAEACGASGRTVRVRYGKGDLELTQVDEGTELGLTVLVGERVGFASTNQVGARALEDTASAATTLARLSLADPHAGLVERAAAAARLPLVHAELARAGVEQCSALARDFVKRTLALDERLSLDRAALELACRAHAIHSSRGVHATSSSTTLSGSLFGMAVDGADVGGFDSSYEIVRDPSLWRERSQSAAARFADAAVGNLGAGRGESYHGAVLLSPQAFLSVLVAPLVSAASALAVQRGRSALAGKLGTSIASSALTMRDDPLDPELAGARAFDREGTPTRELAIVRAGVLESYLYHGYAARVEGRASTGHASGGPRAMPSLGAHALSVRGGGATLSELRARLGRGLLVQRFSGTVDPASGDFSGVAKSARWVERGDAARPVREMLISGNVFALLAGELALSADPERVMGSALAPWALVDGVSVTAG